MKLSLVFMTGREEPHLDWALDSLASQISDDEIDLIVVDTRGRALVERELVILDRINAAGRGSIRARVTLPKPTIWQGAHRVTSSDWWATANARNTAICMAQHDYLAFLDDRCRLGPHWLETVRQAARKRASVVVGSYEKTEGAEGLPNNLLRVTHDHRRERFPNGKINCGGGWLYGCTFTLPLAWALDVNGFEEGCDSLTGEDYIFGLMLGHAGYRIDFTPELYVAQDRTIGNETCKGSFTCRDKGTSPNDKSHAALKRFGTRKRTELTPNLVELRQVLSRGGAFPVPSGTDQRDWYDGQLVREMA